MKPSVFQKQYSGFHYFVILLVFKCHCALNRYILFFRERYLLVRNEKGEERKQVLLSPHLSNLPIDHKLGLYQTEARNFMRSRILFHHLLLSGCINRKLDEVQQPELNGNTGISMVLDPLCPEASLGTSVLNIAMQQLYY